MLTQLLGVGNGNVVGAGSRFEKVNVCGYERGREFTKLTHGIMCFPLSLRYRCVICSSLSLLHYC